MSQVLQDLIDILDLEPLEVNLFRGQSRDLGTRSVFGGQVISQSLVAAGRTVERNEPHSLHAYFLRPGDMEHPIVYEVDRVRDGRSFTTRRVQAIQHGQVILTMIASFQKREAGLEHQAKMPDVPPPEALLSQRELLQAYVDNTPTPNPRVVESSKLGSAIEFKPVRPWNLEAPEKREPAQAIWFRASGPLPDDQMLHRCVLAYASDFNLLSTALLPHGHSWHGEDMAIASIDHALWFHRDVRVDDWLLYAMDSPSSQGARGLSRGLVFDRVGRLVASVAQENLMREI